MSRDLYTSETLMQLFVQGPTWDGNLVSKEERDRMVDAGQPTDGTAGRDLTQEGVVALAGGMAARHWRDKRWYKKASRQ